MRWLSLVLVVGCVLPDDDLDRDGWSARDGDCDDLDPSINPDAPDSVEDDIDQDCDGISPIKRTDVFDYSCILGNAGEVVCDGIESPDPERIWVQLESGYNHSCALDNFGLLDCWGDNSAGQTEFPPGRFISVDASLNYSTAVPEGLGPRAIPDCWGDCPENISPE